MGENFITYPLLEEYDIPTMEEFPEEDPDEDDEDFEKEEKDSLDSEHKHKKNGVTHAGGRKISAFDLLLKRIWESSFATHMDSDECNP